MKLFVIATLIAVSAAARLEHLEQQQNLRAYLPPSYGNGHGSAGSFGAHSQSGAFGAAGAGQPGFNARGAFPSTSNQYLPPDHGPSASVPAGSPQFAGSLNGFGAQDVHSQQFGHQARTQQFGHQAAPSQYGHLDATPQGSNPFGAAASFQHQPSAANQYLAPHVHSSENIPQQPFDEQTGYHY